MREIKQIVQGTATKDGAGVKLTRVLSRPNVKDFDPFLMLDAFDSHDKADFIKGFPWHPHRGIETVTFIVEGDVEHGDSMGNKGAINDGCCQWMTAGSGIIHQEMPKGDRMLGLQLWVNLPKKNKMTRPAYRDIRSDMIPVVKEEGALIKVMSGKYNGVKGPVEGDYVKVLYLDVTLNPGAVWEIETDKELNMFAYIFKGEAEFGGEKNYKNYISAKNAVLFTEGKNLAVKAGKDGAHFVLIGGKPLKEPVEWGGPIVMNTREELHTAFAELENNTFIKDNHPKEVKF
nr:pirin family protein [Elusimicrobium minutum]